MLLFTLAASCWVLTLRQPPPSIPLHHCQPSLIFSPVTWSLSPSDSRGEGWRGEVVRCELETGDQEYTCVLWLGCCEDVVKDVVSMVTVWGKVCWLHSWCLVLKSSDQFSYLQQTQILTQQHLLHCTALQIRHWVTEYSFRFILDQR